MTAGTPRHETANAQGRQAEAQAGGGNNSAALTSQNAADVAQIPSSMAASPAAPDGSGSPGAQPVASVGAASVSAGPPVAADGAPPPAAGAPAAQVAQGLSAMHLSGAGARQITIHLTPGTLGAVQVRIERGTDGAATITLQAEKAETLHALQQDSAHLHEALDRAGLPSAGRQVSYELAQNQASAGAASATGPGVGQGGDQSGSFSGDRSGQRGQTAQPQTQSYARAEADASDRSAPTQGRTRATAVSGINITA